ncbi:MAG: hypothetical protein ABSH10_04540 [Phycisphaerae bacterium]|jgi:hypothetical protein
MDSWDLPKTNDDLKPPTKETIEKDRKRQLEAIQELRRILKEHRHQKAVVPH